MCVCVCRCVGALVCKCVCVCVCVCVGALVCKCVCVCARVSLSMSVHMCACVCVFVGGGIMFIWVLGQELGSYFVVNIVNKSVQIRVI